jgi:hypothetical protein
MSFVFGNRSGISGSSTILRSTGYLNQGTQVPVSVPANQFVAIGNPYASPVKISSISKSNILDVFYVWDPALGGTYGLGGYQVISRHGAGYEIFPGGGSYGPQLSFVDNIESGQAFFVRGDSACGSLFFEESDKGSGSNQVFFTSSSQQRIRANLFAIEQDSSRLVDAVMIKYDTLYNNFITNDDIVKIGNSNENLSIQYSGTSLMIEKKQRLFSGDTIFFKVTGFRQQSYQWKFSIDNLEYEGVRAFLYDCYLQTASELSFFQMSTINFQIDNNAGSFSSDRFFIFFKEAVVLPLNRIQLYARQKTEGQIEILWSGVSGSNVKKYELERSNDGIHFLLIHSTFVDINASGETWKYQFCDIQPFDSVNFYRLKSISIAGIVQYSDIVKIVNVKTVQISVYPNPVLSNKINLWFRNQPQGKYIFELNDINGQLLLKKKIDVNSLMQLIIIEIPEFVRNKRIIMKIIDHKVVKKCILLK